MYLRQETILRTLEKKVFGFGQDHKVQLKTPHRNT